jgi:hypothetical protein
MLLTEYGRMVGRKTGGNESRNLNEHPVEYWQWFPWIDGFLKTALVSTG